MRSQLVSQSWLVRSRTVALVGGVALALALAPAVITRAADDSQPLTEVAFLADAYNYPDALAASAAAGMLGAPVLLTSSASLDPAAADGLLDVDPDEVILVGGSSALSEQVRVDVEELGFDVERVAGENRQATASALAAYISDAGVGRPVVTGREVAAGTIPGLDAETVQGWGPQDFEDLEGPQGPQGPAGPQGEAGQPGGLGAPLVIFGAPVGRSVCETDGYQPWIGCGDDIIELSSERIDGTQYAAGTGLTLEAVVRAEEDSEVCLQLRALTTGEAATACLDNLTDDAVQDALIVGPVDIADVDQRYIIESRGDRRSTDTEDARPGAISKITLHFEAP